MSLLEVDVRAALFSALPRGAYGPLSPRGGSFLRCQGPGKMLRGAYGKPLERGLGHPVSPGAHFRVLGGGFQVKSACVLLLFLILSWTSWRSLGCFGRPGVGSLVHL